MVETYDCRRWWTGVDVCDRPIEGPVLACREGTVRELVGRIAMVDADDIHPRTVPSISRSGESFQGGAVREEYRRRSPRELNLQETWRVVETSAENTLCGRKHRRCWICLSMCLMRQTRKRIVLRQRPCHVSLRRLCLSSFFLSTETYFADHSLVFEQFIFN